MDQHEDPEPPVIEREAFSSVIRSEERLRAIYPSPTKRVVAKTITVLDDYCRAIIARSPLVFIGTSSANGRCDVSPRGGPPGFVQVLDDRRLAFSDLPGNRRNDSMHNLFENAHVGMLFVIPGMEETLRLNGRAWVVQDEEILKRVALMDKVRPMAIGVEVEEVFIHCAKALIRSNAWRPERWPALEGLPSAGAIIKAHAGRNLDVTDTADQIDASLAVDKVKGLY